MKIESQLTKPDWQPVEITIRLESKEELQALYQLSLMNISIPREYACFIRDQSRVGVDKLAFNTNVVQTFLTRLKDEIDRFATETKS